MTTSPASAPLVVAVTPPASAATPGAPTAYGWTWGSLAVAVAAVAAAAVADLWPGHVVPASLQATLSGSAALLTALHVHVPKILNKL